MSDDEPIDSVCYVGVTSIIESVDNRELRSIKGEQSLVAHVFAVAHIMQHTLSVCL